MAFEARPERPAKYQQVADRLRGAIQSGDLRPGQGLPTEKQLSERYAVSRPTVRAALALLRTEGLIESRQGSGAYVRLRHTPRRVPAPHRPDTRGAAGRAGVGQITEAGPTVVRGDVASMLGVADGVQAFVRRRLVAGQDGDPRELVAHYFPLVGKPPDRLEERTASLISARMPSAAEAEALAMPAGVPLLAMLLGSYDADGDPIEVMETLWPSDRYAVYDEYPSGEPVGTDTVPASAEQSRRLGPQATEQHRTPPGPDEEPAEREDGGMSG